MKSPKARFTIGQRVYRWNRNRRVLGEVVAFEQTERGQEFEVREDGGPTRWWHSRLLHRVNVKEQPADAREPAL
jgi:hypothetical protein